MGGTKVGAPEEQYGIESAEPMKVAVIGAAGYAGGELLRLLFQHPMITEVQCISQSQVGKPLSSVHDDMYIYPNKTFAGDLHSCDVAFLCGDHGQSQELIQRHDVYHRAPRVIDLSQDFRNGSNGFVYGLSEVYAEAIRGSVRVANPGCFATAIQLALAPLAHKGLLHEPVHITAITGSTGAGQKLQKTSHFSQRSQNMSTYKVFDHQHLTEIRRTLTELSGTTALPELYFVPVRGPFTRGIIASLYTPYQGSDSDLLSLYQDYYARAPFVHVSVEEANLKSVINTNHVRLHVQKHEGLVHVVACLDNLLKGASGQAIQNLNLMMDWPLDSGLQLKPIAY